MTPAWGASIKNIIEVAPQKHGLPRSTTFSSSVGQQNALDRLISVTAETGNWRLSVYTECVEFRVGTKTKRTVNRVYEEHRQRKSNRDTLINEL